MALNKQGINLNFAQGLDLKTDPYQVAAGKMLNLQNIVFDRGGRLQKRNGFSSLPTLPNDLSTTATTFQGNLIAAGTTLNLLSQSTGKWYDTGSIQPLSLDVTPIVRNSMSQLTTDVTIVPNGLGCTVYYSSNGDSYYQIFDSQSGDIIIPQTQITGVCPRVFTLGNNFIITIINGVALQYIAIPTYNPINPGSPTDLSTLMNLTDLGYDGCVYNNSLYVAFNGSDGGGAIRVTFLSSTLAQGNTIVVNGHSADLVSITPNQGTGSAALALSFWDSNDMNGYTMILTPSLLITLNPTQIITGINIHELTSVFVNSLITVLYETINTYTYETTVRSDYTSSLTVTTTGTVSSPVILLRSVGIASKAFYFAPTNKTYCLLVYGGAFQPTYFLSDLSGNVILKLAYSNGEQGYNYNQILSNVTIINNTVYFGYIFADQILAVNKTQGVINNDGIYAQTGVNLASVTIQDQALITAEIGNNLFLAGGILYAFDGVKPVEQGFNVWPEDIYATGSATGGGLAPEQYFYQFCYEWTDAQGNLQRSAPSVPFELDLRAINQVTYPVTFDSDVNVITVPSTTGIYIGAQVYDSTNPDYIPDGTTVSAISGTTITLSQSTTGAGSPDYLNFTGSPVTFTGTFTQNSTTITVSSATGLIVGQIITDNTNPGYLQANTHIVTISGTTLTIDLPTLQAGTGDSLQTLDTLSAIINVPTLRVTAKSANNPVRIVGYRWSEDQQIYYQFTSILNPVLNDTTIDYVTITDTNSDFGILGNVIIYTTGGVVEDIGAPPTSTMTLYKSRLFLVDAEDQNLIWFSKQVIESTPVEMSDLLTLYVAPTISAQGSTGPITALSAMDDKLIVFKKDAIYYLTGDGPDNTGANSDFGDFIFITSTVGCINQNSIVFMPSGLMFQSDKGIWLLGRDLSTTYIGAPVEPLTLEYTVESALNIPATNQVRFTMSSGITLMYDYYYQQWGTFVNIPALSSTIYQGLHTYINSFGEVFQESLGTYVDGSSPVLMSFTSAWFNLAGLQGYERAYSVYLLATYITPHILSVGIAYDYNPTLVQNSLIMPVNYNNPYGIDPLYGSTNFYGGNNNIEQWRIFLARQKCQSFQITITESFDSSKGTMPGAGLTMSGLDLLVGTKGGYNRLKPKYSVG